MKSPRRMKVGLVLLFMGIGLMAGGVSMLLQPNVYRSVATVEAGRQPGSLTGYDPYFLLTEFEIIKSHDVLTNVIATLNLSESWGKKYNRGPRLSDSKTEKMIKRQLGLDHVNNTKFIEIGVYDDDPNEAAKLANAIAERYCEFRTEQFRRLAAEIPNPNERSQFEGPQIMVPAVCPMRPTRPDRYLEMLMMGFGSVLMAGGLIIYNYSED